MRATANLLRIQLLRRTDPGQKAPWWWFSAGRVLERQCFDQAVKLGLQPCQLFRQRRLPVGEGGQALLGLVELTGVRLYLLLLSADRVQALDIAADAVLVAIQ